MAGMSGVWTGWKAQCPSQATPSSIQRRSSSRSAAVGAFPVEGGGITRSGSSCTSLASSSLSSGAPGSATKSTSSCTSRRRSPLRAAASGPWQSKQYSERIGSTSRPKSTGPSPTTWTEISARSARVMAPG